MEPFHSLSDPYAVMHSCWWCCCWSFYVSSSSALGSHGNWVLCCCSINDWIAIYQGFDRCTDSYRLFKPSSQHSFPLCSHFPDPHATCVSVPRHLWCPEHTCHTWSTGMAGTSDTRDQTLWWSDGVRMQLSHDTRPKVWHQLCDWSFVLQGSPLCCFPHLYCARYSHPKPVLGNHHR